MALPDGAAQGDDPRSRTRETIRVAVPGVVGPPPEVDAHASRTQTLLDLPAHAKGAGAPPAQADARRSPRGRSPGPRSPSVDGLQGRVGDHELLGLLGRGGMGAVYRAVHLPTGAVRALKLVAPSGVIDVARFKREAEAMATVGGHPNVLRIHATGEAGGLLWYSMDVAEGESLERRLANGPLPPLEVARLGAQLARGLAHVHSHGVLHRDLKPANVLFDAAGTPMIVDFGLAAVAGSERLTETGVVVGTPLYMAPEQVVGDRAIIDARTDVYGLGAVLYEAASGRPPIDGSSSIEVMSRVVHARPEPLRSLVDVPRGLEAVVHRCLEKAAADRYATALELAVDLEAVARGERPSALGAGALSGPTAILAGLALVALLVAGAAVTRGGRAGVAPIASAGPAAPTSRAAPAARLDDEVAGLLAREDEAGALARLEAALREAPAREAELAPLVLAALAVAETPEQRAPWLARPAFAQAARDAAALGQAEGTRPTLPGHAGVVDGLAELAKAAVRWRAEFKPEGATIVPPVERLVAAAAAGPRDALGMAMRVRTQRAVAGVDGMLMRTFRDPAGHVRAMAALGEARRLAPDTPASAALELSERFLGWHQRTGVERPLRLDALRALPARHTPQRVEGLAMAIFLLDPRDPTAVAEGLTAWDALAADGLPLGLLQRDAMGVVSMGLDVSLELAPLADLVVDAYEARVRLLIWQAWFARSAGDAELRARLRAATDAAVVVRAMGKSHGAELAAEAAIMCGDSKAALEALSTATGDDGPADRPLRALEAEAALLGGDVGRARACLRALLPHITDAATRAELHLALAAVEAHAGAFDVADDLVDEARADIIEAGAAAPPLLPWRTLDVTRRLVDAVRGGWRCWEAKRPWVD